MDTIDLFLKESNAIEDVWDEESLVQARKAWDYIIGEKELTPLNILRTHKILMEGKLPNAGEWRVCEVMIGGHYGKPWPVVPTLICSWVRKVNDKIKESKVKAWQRIKGNHIEYESIHPFVDGNGRTGRIFLNWQRVKAGMDILVIEEKKKNDYYEWFQTKGANMMA